MKNFPTPVNTCTICNFVCILLSQPSDNNIHNIFPPPSPHPPLELERILDCIIFINTVRPVLCDLSREQSNMVT